MVKIITILKYKLDIKKDYPVLIFNHSYNDCIPNKIKIKEMLKVRK